jgi:tetratricopeptide (TPR) repeat protein
MEKALSIPGPQPLALRARALNGAGVLARGQGDYDRAGLFLHECLDIQESLGNKNGIANAQNSLGILAHLQQDYTTATFYHQESLKYRRETGEKREIAVALHNLSMIDQEKGDFKRAEELLNESLALLLAVNDTRSIAATQLSLGYILYEQGEVDRSEDLFRKCLVVFNELGARNDMIECLEGFAGTATLRKQPERGARLMVAAQSVRKAIGIPVARYHQSRYHQIVENITIQLNSQSLDINGEEDTVMSLEEAIEFALHGSG